MQHISVIVLSTTDLNQHIKQNILNNGLNVPISIYDFNIDQTLIEVADVVIYKSSTTSYVLKDRYKMLGMLQ
jgi:hypothetical protein